MARLIVTLDVSSELREDIKSDLAPLLQIDSVTDVGLSEDPETYIRIIEEATRWSLLLKAAAGIFLTQLAKNAADDYLWKDRSAIAKALQSAAIWPIRRMVHVFKRVLEAHPYSWLEIGIPVLDSGDEAGLRLRTKTTEYLAITLAVFIWHVEKLRASSKSTERTSLDGSKFVLSPMVLFFYDG